ncbi:MAG: hypothetical protein JSV04_13580 [Candidatus Heimdallarchaeota archaeon]|nr:MAG: hypothetical protein JSV04_13580 [Candidatus Heimdallarchaeota archaeon]
MVIMQFHAILKKLAKLKNTLQLIINIRVAARLPRKDIITNLTDRIKFLSKRKVSVQILLIGMTSQILEEEYVGTMAKFFEVIDKAEVKHTQLNPMAFDIIDDEKVLLKVMNPVKPDEFFAWIFVWQKKIALELKTKFQELWVSAIELK